MNTRSPIELLKRLGVKPSVHRVAIMKYLLETNSHPAADDIYNALKDTTPTLSKATVYNTLRLLEEHNAVQALTLDSHTVRYDGFTHPHAHLLCSHCGIVYDLPLDTTTRENLMQQATDCDITNVQLFYYGLCPNCK